MNEKTSGNNVVHCMVAAMVREGLVEEVLAFVTGMDSRDIVPAFIGPEHEVHRITTASYNPLSLATLLARYGDHQKKIGVVLRSCDARALVELAKRNQIDLDNLYLIGIECSGVASASKGPAGELHIMPNRFEVDGKKQDPDEKMLRPNCLRCEYPIPTMADVTCGISPHDARVTALTEKGEQILEVAGLAQGEGEDPGPLKQRAIQRQEGEFGELTKMKHRERLAYWLSHFDRCVKCYGCRDVCPICYCKDCYLGPEHALVKGRELPPERMFHLTRLIHVAPSCVNCGQCEAVCPAGIPISRLYHALNKELGAIFGYESGCDPGVPPPLDTISEEELTMKGVGYD